ncbi:unnamed protein product, partial [Iphiclides podalirius]
MSTWHIKRRGKIILEISKKRALLQKTGCDNVCEDLPLMDFEPVCMMFSRYKKGYQFFVNQCHARRAICMEKIVLHMVHPSRCFRSKQFFMPLN